VTLDRQRGHWSSTYAANPEMYGTTPSESATRALGSFRAADVRTVLELGPGQGRDTLYFAAQGLRIYSVDYARSGLLELRDRAQRAKVNVHVAEGDVRDGLPVRDASVDACYSHMLFCMALRTAELEELSRDVARVLRPGGVVVYTARTTADAHYGTGIPRGDGMYEHGGFIVHFFDPGLIDRLSAPFGGVAEQRAFEEGDLPRRLVLVTMHKAA
jgi:SAM-dependent methyltransferase